MKILLSAYACEPNQGSEPGVGWNWAIELARLGHDVFVLTRKNNKVNIETELSSNTEYANLNFIYYDLPNWVQQWKKRSGSVHIYYFLWQWFAFRLARRIHTKENFERVHHVTFVSVRQPSFMGGLNIPFIFGPVAGGERAPWRLRLGYSMQGWLLDGIRDLANFIVKFDPFMWRTFNKAMKIYVTSEQTRNLIPQRFRYKTSIQLAIGWEGNKTNTQALNDNSDTFRILYVGHFLYLKGMHLGLEAFAKFVKRTPNTRLTLVGKGPEEKRWKLLVDKLGISDYVDWVPWVEQNNLKQLYQKHDVFLFPSLHDSGGMVVLEAMSYGLPVISFDLGGPGVMVNNTCGRVVKTNKMGATKVTHQLADYLSELASDRELYSKLSEGALIRSKEYMWENVINKILKSV